MAKWEGKVTEKHVVAAFEAVGSGDIERLSSPLDDASEPT